jgi:hypothetical protein
MAERTVVNRMVGGSTPSLGAHALQTFPPVVRIVHDLRICPPGPTGRGAPLKTERIRVRIPGRAPLSRSVVDSLDFASNRRRVLCTDRYRDAVCARVGEWDSQQAQTLRPQGHLWVRLPPRALDFATVAQLVEASGREPEGSRFESGRWHHGTASGAANRRRAVNASQQLTGFESQLSQSMRSLATAYAPCPRHCFAGLAHASCPPLSRSFFPRGFYNARATSARRRTWAVECG